MKSSVWLAVVVSVLLIGIIFGAPKQKSIKTGVESARVVKISSMSVQRAAHQATLLRSGKVLITGGCAGQGCEHILKSVELFDPDTRSFQKVADMHISRASHSAILLNDGRVLVSGGWDGSKATASAEIYDPNTDHWILVGDMNVPRASNINTLLPNGRILVTGGGSGGLGNLKSAEIFDPLTKTFSSIQSMHATHYLATTLADGRILLTGGQDSDGNISNKAEIFDPSDNSFHKTGNMNTARVKHAAALLSNGKVMIIGGSDHRGYNARFNSTEIYDPQKNRFSIGPPLHEGRHKIRDAVCVLSANAIVVAGGAKSIEIFDPLSQRFTTAEGKLSAPQMFATATPLSSGSVLILGGYDNHTRSSSSAWLMQL